MPINKVGIKGYSPPYDHQTKIGQRAINNCKLQYVCKFTSRFQGYSYVKIRHILNNHEEQITVDSFKKMIDEMLILLKQNQDILK